MKNFWEHEAGATSAQYGLWVALIAMLLIGSVSALSNIIHG